MSDVRVIDLGRMAYAEAYREQCRHVDEVLATREAGRAEMGRVLMVEHPAVITVTRRAGAMGHLLVSREQLVSRGVTLEETDRGGDITYHGPGQIVCYPILDLNTLNLGLHAYMRLLEESVIGTCGEVGIECVRDAGATGVWVRGADGGAEAKVCAMGVRVRKWVSMHGLALNVSPDLSHFDLIVACGLVGRRVTSLEREWEARGLAGRSMDDVRSVLARRLVAAVREQADRAAAMRRG